MAKEERNYSKEFKKQSVLIYITMFLALLSCILGFVNACNGNKNKYKYDVSMMHTVGVNQVLEMIDEEETFVLYVGRETCDVCVELLPTLQQAQLDLNFVTQYMDITQVDRKSSAWATLVEKLNIKTSTTLSDDGDDEVVTETFGYFLDQKGFTPCVIIIKDGKQISGFFGIKSLTNYKDWLEENGI